MDREENRHDRALYCGDLVCPVPAPLILLSRGDEVLMGLMDSVTAISIARTYFTIIVSYNNEEESRSSFMHNLSLLALWAMVEVNVGILAACITVVKKGVRKVFAGELKTRIFVI